MVISKMIKVLITPRSFGKYSDVAKNQLLEAGITIVNNQKGSILNEDELIELIKDVDGVIIGVDPLSEHVLSEAKKLKAIAKYGVGVDNIDLDYCRLHDIPVSITQNANMDAVADYAFALMLGVARKITEINHACHLNDWSKNIAVDVYGKRLGILGFGHIGKGVALRAKGFAMDVLAYDVNPDHAFASNHGIRYTNLDEILTSCDFISIHLPLLPETRYLINKEVLARMRKNAIIVNTARGGIIDEDALYEALVNKQIYGVGLDVFEREPAGDSPLLNLPNVIAGSHTAASTEGAVENMSNFAVVNLLNDLRNKGVI